MWAHCGPVSAEVKAIDPYLTLEREREREREGERGREREREREREVVS